MDSLELVSPLGPRGRRSFRAGTPPDTLLLYPHGEACVVLPQVGIRHGNRRSTIKVSVPCNENNVRILGAAIRALGPHVIRSDRTDGVSPSAYVRYRWNGSAGDLPLCVGLLDGQDFMSEGIYREFFACAHYNLTVAVASAQCAENLVREGEAGVAVQLYRQAFEAIDDWDREASLRASASGRIVEPLLGTRLAHALILRADDKPPDVQCYKMVWVEVTRDVFSVTWEENAATIRFSPAWAQLLNVKAMVSCPGRSKSPAR